MTNKNSRIAFWLVPFLFVISLVGLTACGGGGSSGGSGSPASIWVAASPSGNGWFSDNSDNEILEYSGTGSPSSPLMAISVKSPGAIAVDSSGNIWAIVNNASLNEYNASGTLLNSFTTSTTPIGMSFCGEELWEINQNSNAVQEISPTTGKQIGSFTTSSQPAGITCDGNGNLWLNYNNSKIIQEFNTTGLSLASFSATDNPTDICYQGGNLWVTNNSPQIQVYAPSGNLINDNVNPQTSLDSANIACGGGVVWVSEPFTSTSNISLGEGTAYNSSSYAAIVNYALPAPTSSSGSGGIPQGIPPGTYTGLMQWTVNTLSGTCNTFGGPPNNAIFKIGTSTITLIGDNLFSNVQITGTIDEYDNITISGQDGLGGTLTMTASLTPFPDISTTQLLNGQAGVANGYGFSINIGNGNYSTKNDPQCVSTTGTFSGADFLTSGAIWYP